MCLPFVPLLRLLATLLALAMLATLATLPEVLSLRLLHSAGGINRQPYQKLSTLSHEESYLFLYFI